MANKNYRTSDDEPASEMSTGDLVPVLDLEEIGRIDIHEAIALVMSDAGHSASNARDGLAVILNRLAML